MQAKQPVLVFSVAAPEDAVWLTQWEKHLLPLQRAGHLRLWSERLLLAGENRSQQMNRQIDQADLIVFLLSPDFFVSEECITLMERALTRRQNEQVTLVPLLLRPSIWQDSSLSSLIYLPPQALPVTSWSHVDEAFQECTMGLSQILGLPRKDMPKKHKSPFPPTQRLQVIHALQQEYRRRRDHSLQGQVAIELGLHERTDVIASSARLVFHDTETERPLPTGTTITQVYDDAGRGLLILGVPGSGKTTLLLDLALELLRRAEKDAEHPIPIILSLSRWGTTKLMFADWLCEQLYLVYGIARKVGASWIEQDQILFALDGLDEMDVSAHSGCVAAINSYRSEHFAPLVVSSRSREYEQQQVRLILPAAVEIQPLEPTRVSLYLQQAGKSLTAVRTVLQNNTMLQSLLTTPLLLMIVLLTYRNQEANELVQAGSPEDQQRLIFQHYLQRMLGRHHHRRTVSIPYLLRSLCWLSQTMQKQHLTEVYLEQLQPTWLATKQMRATYHLLYGLLMGLVTGLVVGLGGAIGLGTLDGPHAVLILGLATALVVGLVVGLGFGPLRGLLLGLVIGPIAGLGSSLFTALSLKLSWDYSTFLFFQGIVYGALAGLFFGTLAGFLTERRTNKLAEKVTWSWRRCGKGVLFGLLGGLILALVVGLSFQIVILPPFTNLSVGLGFGSIVPPILELFGGPFQIVLPAPFTNLSVGLDFGSIFPLIFGLFGGLSGTSKNPDLHRRPNQGVRIVGWNAIRFGLVFLLVFGLLTGLIAGLFGGGLLGGLFAGSIVGLLGGLLGTIFGGGAMYLQHHILRFLLWRSGALPWKAIPLLEEATDCILLQRVGGGYRFIHPLLQEHFASIDVEAMLEQSKGQTKVSSDAN